MSKLLLFGVGRSRVCPISFLYTPGESLNDASFTRASAATYIDSNSVIQDVTSDALRDNHFIGGNRYTLIESASTNLVVRSEPLVSQTTVFGTVTDAAGFSGLARSIQFPATNTFDAAFLGPSPLAGPTYVYSAYAIADDLGAITTGSSGTTYELRINGNGTLNADNRTLHIGNNVYWSEGKRVSTSGNSQAGPARLAVPHQDRAFRVSGYQFEQRPFATSLIRTTGVAASRSVDSLTIPGKPGKTLYLRYYDLATRLIIDSVAAYAGAPITPTVDRAYSHIAVLRSTLTLQEARDVLGVA